MKYILLILTCSIILLEIVQGQLECLEDPQGINYIGKVSMSLNGACGFWFNATGNTNYNEDNQFIDITVRDAQNYCRNPKGKDGKYDSRPFCWLQSDSRAFGYCNIPTCQSLGLCRDTYVGESYRGNISRTVSGLTCQRWDSQTPHSHNFNAGNWPIGKSTETIATSSNFCRNPGNSSLGLWCYTNDARVRWEPCMAALCNSTYECIAGKAPYSFKSLTRTEQYLQSCEAWSSVPLSFINNQNQLPQFYSNATDSSAIVQPPFSPALLPDSSLSEAENFCRNPDNDDKGAWCYVKEGNKYAKKYCKTPCTGIWACLFDRVGQYYQGKINKTETGVDCQRWDTSGQTFTASSFPDTTLADASNYCRNPDSNPGGPWCYTVFATKKFGFCTLPICRQTPPIPPLTISSNTSLCQLTAAGIEYTGTVSTARSGRACLDWSIQSPNNPYFNRPQLFNVANMSEVRNYCRNPSRVLTGPWCYTSVGEEACDIQKCFTTRAPTLPPGTRTVCRSTLAGVEYNGTVSVTAENVTCLRWDSVSNLIYKDSDFPEKSIRLADNYCRNPNKVNHIGTFCYVIIGGAANERPCVVPMCGTSQCRTTSEGFTYNGTKSTSKSGKTCLPWRTFISSIDPDVLPDTSVEDAKNYCRNPNKANNFDGPFCYVNNGGTNEPETCGINYCTKQCRNSPAGQEYAGIISYAGTLKCRTWEDASNTLFRNPTPLNAATLQEASNYCRNPNNDTKGPWCYTAPQVTSYCSLPVCSPSGNCYTNSTAWAYTGTVNVTQNNLPCLKWSNYDPNTFIGLPGPVFAKEIFPDSSIQEANNYCRTPTADSQYRDRPWCYLDMTAIFNANPNNPTIPTQSYGFCNVTQCVITTTESTTATTTVPTTPTTTPPTTPIIFTTSSVIIGDVCVTPSNVSSYQGFVNTTSNGVACMRWMDFNLSNYKVGIAGPTYNKALIPDKSVVDASNYCRVPTSEAQYNQKPWCYISPIVANAQVSNTNFGFCNVTTCGVNATTDPITTGYIIMNTFFAVTLMSSVFTLTYSTMTALEASGLINEDLDMYESSSATTTLPPSSVNSNQQLTSDPMLNNSQIVVPMNQQLLQNAQPLALPSGEYSSITPAHAGLSQSQGQMMRANAGPKIIGMGEDKIETFNMARINTAPDESKMMKIQAGPKIIGMGEDKIETFNMARINTAPDESKMMKIQAGPKVLGFIEEKIETFNMGKINTGPDESKMMRIKAEPKVLGFIEEKVETFTMRKVDAVQDENGMLKIRTEPKILGIYEEKVNTGSKGGRWMAGQGGGKAMAMGKDQLAVNRSSVENQGGGRNSMLSFDSSQDLYDIEELIDSGIITKETLAEEDGITNAIARARAMNMAANSGSSQMASGGNGGNMAFGGSGGNMASGGSGGYMAYGGSGGNMASGGSGGYMASGGSGGNMAYGGSGGNKAYAGSGSNMAYAGSGGYMASGGSGGYMAYGGSGGNVASGGSGGNMAYGGSGGNMGMSTNISGNKATSVNNNPQKISANKLVYIGQSEGEPINEYLDIEELIDAGAISFSEIDGSTQIDLSKIKNTGSSSTASVNVGQYNSDTQGDLPVQAPRNRTSRKSKNEENEYDSL